MNHFANYFYERAIYYTKPYLCFFTSNDESGILRNKEIMKISGEYPKVPCVHLDWKKIKNAIKLDDYNIYDCFILLCDSEYEKHQCVKKQEIKNMFSYVDHLCKISIDLMFETIMADGFSKHMAALEHSNAQTLKPREGSFLQSFIDFQKFQSISDVEGKQKEEIIYKNLKYKKITENKSSEKYKNILDIHTEPKISRKKLIKSINCQNTDSELKNNENTLGNPSIIKYKIKGSSFKRKQRKPKSIEHLRRMPYFQIHKIPKL